ncbi:MAG: hypothetical protein IFNCLDLE_01082 [Ignavibacteriaceae bacterium]|nr:hypothetical protein [Ignavibacteriaceae bacterium]
MSQEEKKDNSSIFALVMFSVLGLGVLALLLKVIIGF